MSGSGAGQPQAIDFGRLAAAGGLGTSGNDHVPQKHVDAAPNLANSGNSHPTMSSAGGGGLNSSIGSQGELDNVARASDVNQVTSFGSVSDMVHIGEDVNMLDVFDGAHAPFGLLKEGAVPALQSEKMQLQHLAVGEQTSAKLQGNTGFMSPSQGGGHSV